MLTADIIGFIAGSLVAGSAVPKLISRIRKVAHGEAVYDAADLVRDSAQALGNLLWVYVGLRSRLLSVASFCAASCVLRTSLLILNLRARVERSREPDACEDA